MSDDSRPVRRAGVVLVILFVGATAAVAAVAAALGIVTAVKGAYAAIGLAFAIAFYYYTRDPTPGFRMEAVRGWKGLDRFGPRLVGLVAVCSVGIAVVTGDRSIGLLLGLPLGFGLLAAQMAAGVKLPTIPLQAVALYAASSVSKYLTNDFYYGGSDTLYQVRNVETLVRTGSVATVPRYDFFPGFHLVTGALSMLGGIRAYDAILLLGIITYGVVVLAAFALVRTVTGNERLGAFVAVGLVMVEPFLYYATYFFPQSLAVALAVFGLYVAYRANQERDLRARFSLVGLVVAIALVATHQLTIVLFVPIVGILFAVTYAQTRFDDRSVENAPPTWPRGHLAAVVGLGSIVYWAYRSTFFAELASSVRAILRLSLFTGDSGAPTQTYTLGTELPALTLETAVRGLLSTDGIYQIALVVVFSLGIAAAIDRPRRYWPVLPLFSVGMVGAVAMFRTPLTVPGLARGQLPVAVFFAVVLGIGLYRLSRSAGRSRATFVAVILLVATVGTTAPLNYNAGGDLYALNAGPNLYELYPTPQPQTEFSDAEYQDLESVAAFAEQYDAPLYTFSVGSQAMRGFGVESGGASVNRSGIVTDEGLFLYRDRFVDHRISYAIGDGVAIGTVLIASEWLDETLTTQNKVYAGGRVGLVWNPDGSPIAPELPGTTTGENGSDDGDGRPSNTNWPTASRARP